MNRLPQVLFYMAILLFVMLSSQAYSQNSVKLGRNVIAGGGSKSTTSIFRSNGTIGQAATGRATTTLFKIGSGFWSGPFTGSCCIGTTGDLNADGIPNTIVDLTFMVDRIFRGGADPICPFEGDLDGNGSPMSILDLTYMIDFIFRGGPSPVACP